MASPDHRDCPPTDSEHDNRLVPPCLMLHVAVQTTLADARSRAQIELPALAAAALARLVKAHESPEKLEELEEAMKKQGLLPSR